MGLRPIRPFSLSRTESRDLKNIEKSLDKFFYTDINVKIITKSFIQLMIEKENSSFVFQPKKCSTE